MHGTAARLAAHERADHPGGFVDRVLYPSDVGGAADDPLLMDREEGDEADAIELGRELGRRLIAAGAERLLERARAEAEEHGAG